MKRILELTLPILALLLIWQFAVEAGIVNRSLFPPPSAVGSALVTLGLSGELFRDIEVSLLRVIIGLIGGILLGVCTGLLTGRSTGMNRALSPIIHSLRPLPPVALIPLFIVWLGIGDVAKITSIVFAVFFPVWMNTHIGASRIPDVYLWSARLMQGSGWTIISRIILPAALPYIISGIRIGIAFSFIMVFVSELAGASSGIGYRISVSHLSYRIDAMMAALFVLGLLGACVDQLFSGVSRMAFPFLKHIHV